MKTTFKTVVILLLTMTFLSCSKEDNSNKNPEQNPLDEYLEIAGFENEYPSLPGLGFYELGFTFKPLVNGNINSIVLNLPNSKENVRVTIWNLETESIVFQDVFDVTIAESSVVFPVNSITLQENKEYIISMNSDQSYINSFNLFNPVNANYPIVIEDIQILNTRSNAGTNQVLPATISLNSYAGNCSFNFQKS